jgi:hypothetical protein
MSSGLRLWNSQGELRLDTNDRVLKLVKEDFYYTTVANSSGWIHEGLTKVTDTSQNDELYTYSVYDLDLTPYISNVSSIAASVSDIKTVTVASEVWSDNGWDLYRTNITTTWLALRGFCIQNGNTLRIYVGGTAFCTKTKTVSSDVGFRSFNLKIMEY